MMVGGGWGAEVHVSVYPKTLNKFNVGTAAFKRQASAKVNSLHINLTLHHEMSRNLPDGHFHLLYFLKENSMLSAMVKTIFKSED